MNRTSQTVERKTKETQIAVTINLVNGREVRLNTGLPFFEHMLHAMAFHGGFSLLVQAEGDTHVDPHHLVEDTGIVFGDALQKAAADLAPINRYGHASIPMDDALSEVVIDACGRPYLEYQAHLPQAHAGAFELSLIREFMLAVANRGKINLHALCKYGLNSHHMIEALFKAFGIALKQAFTPVDSGVRSTKGSLDAGGS